LPDARADASLGRVLEREGYPMTVRKSGDEVADFLVMAVESPDS